MKKFLIWVAVVLVITIILPAIIIFFGSSLDGEDVSEIKTIKVYHADTQSVQEENFEDYICNVVAAEMPAEFETEALKAQAVAARTYALKKIESLKGDESHNGADICTDSTHCQAYISESDAKAKWTRSANKNWAKIKNAVYDTKGEIMTYDGEPITAVFHSSSSGITESAKDVWEGELPYLSNVKSDGEEKCPVHKSSLEISIDTFREKMKEYSADIVIDNDYPIGDITRSEAGGVISISIGDKIFKGTEIRSVFSLRSSNFDVSIKDDIVRFDVTGNGHGVGLSQYGANYMASEGKKYKDILTTYYVGAVCDKMI